MGTPNPPSAACRATVLRQLSIPTSTSSSAVTCPPCTITPRAPTSTAAAVCWVNSLRDGMRIRLFVDATLTM